VKIIVVSVGKIIILELFMEKSHGRIMENYLNPLSLER